MAEPYDHVQLGAYRVPVYEQSAPYMENKIRRFVLGFLDSGENLTTESLMGFLLSNSYGALSALIPNLPNFLPEHEFRGFVSKEAMEEGQFDETTAKAAPTVREIRRAFIVAFEASGVTEILGDVFGVVDKGKVKRWIDKKLDEILETDSTDSASSPSPEDGVQASPSSGTNGRTQTAVLSSASAG